jgi:hypothetical protein
MSIASGFSIQRNDVIQVPHRQQYESHDAISGDRIYLLRSLPDYEDKNWDWDIRMGEVRIHLERGGAALAVNGNNATSTGVGGVGSDWTSENQAWNANAYTEGSLAAGLGTVMYDSQYGEFGAIVFDETAQPMPGEKVEISYIEHKSKFTGAGGLLYQLAHDMCIHPFNTPEIFQTRFGNYQSFDDDNSNTIDGTVAQPYKSNIPSAGLAGSNNTAVTGPNGGTAGDTINIFQNNLSITYKDLLDSDIKEATQRTVQNLWKIVKQHKETTTINMSGTTVATNASLYISETALPTLSKEYSLSNLQAASSSTIDTQYIPLMIDFPLIENDLGSGEFRVSIGGRLIDRDDWIVTSDVPSRRSTFKLKRQDPMPWIKSLGAVEVSIAYVWDKSIDVPYGALVGRQGLGPDQITDALPVNMISFPHDDKIIDADLVDADINKYWVFSRAFRSPTVLGAADPKKAFFGWHTATESSDPHIKVAQERAPAAGQSNYLSLAQIVADDLLSSRHKNIAKISSNDLMYLEMESSDEYARPFQLIYPQPLTSGLTTSDSDIKSKLREITDRFVVESEKGVDLLSDTNLSFVNSNSPASNRKPQKWRMRFVWDDTTLSLKVNVGTDLQILDDCTVSVMQNRDGVKSPIFREPGELCDVYQTPAIGRGTSVSISRAKSQFFRKSQIEKEMARSYPMSFKMTVTDHGMGLFIFDQASVDQDDDYAWVVVQRHVNQSTGQPEFGDKSPVHCVYSPSKRPVDISTLTPYYSSSDINDMSKPATIYSSLAGVFKTEAPTVYISKDAGFFNGSVNAIDFNGYGYASGTARGSVAATTLEIPAVKTDLFRGMSGNLSAINTELWYEKTYSFFVKIDDPANPPLIQKGHYLACRNKAGTVDDTNPVIWGGRVKEWFPTTGKITIFSVNNITGEEIRGADIADPSACLADTLLKLIDDDTATDGTTSINLEMGMSNSGDVTDGTFQAFSSDDTAVTRDAEYKKTTVKLRTMPYVNISGPSSEITDLSITGFNSLPRRRDTSIVLSSSISPGAIEQVPEQTGTDPAPALIRAITDTGDNLVEGTPAAATWAIGNDTASQFSQNVIWPTNIIERMSTFKNASLDGTGLPTSVENINLSNYAEGDSALMDILYTAQPENVDKVFESMVVTLDEVEIARDSKAYILTYDEWVRRGDPTTVPRFMESLEAAGVTNLGPRFRIPAVDASIPPNFNSLQPGMDPNAVNNAIISYTTQNFSTGKKFFSEWNTTSTGVYSHVASGVIDDPTGTGSGFGTGSSNTPIGDDDTPWVQGVDFPHWDLSSGVSVTSARDQKLSSKLPGDIIWTNTTGRNEYMYDFWNKSLYFKNSPRSGAAFSISMINYQTSNPSQGTYIVSTPEDRNFPETNMNDVKSINRFVVREKDVLKPWDYHVSATMHEVDSHAIINPQEQLSITQGRNFVFSFPTQLTTQRFYYPESELDLICVSSADFSTQAGYVEIDKYSDSDGIITALGAGYTDPVQADIVAANVSGHEINADLHAISDERAGAYGGHMGPDGYNQIWRKNKRRYEGMPSTLPNGNGMRIFLQVTGSSISYSDVEDGTAPAA